MQATRTINTLTLTALSCASLNLAATAVNGEASVRLVHPTTIAAVTPLHFGTIAAEGKAGSAAIDIAGVPTLTNLGDGNGADAPTRGQFDITGSGNMKYNVQINPDVTLTCPTSTKSLKVAITHIDLEKAVEAVPGGGMFESGNKAWSVMPGTGKATLFVAGQLDVPADAEGGLYKGDFLVSVIQP
jgi:hypothetical protein